MDEKKTQRQSQFHDPAPNYLRYHPAPSRDTVDLDLQLPVDRLGKATQISCWHHLIDVRCDAGGATVTVLYCTTQFCSDLPSLCIVLPENAVSHTPQAPNRGRLISCHKKARRTTFIFFGPIIPGAGLYHLPCMAGGACLGNPALRTKTMVKLQSLRLWTSVSAALGNKERIILFHSYP